MGHPAEMSQQHRIQGKTKLVVALNDFHAVQDQIIEPFVLLQLNLHVLFPLHQTKAH